MENDDTPIKGYQIVCSEWGKIYNLRSAIVNRANNVITRSNSNYLHWKPIIACSVSVFLNCPKLSCALGSQKFVNKRESEKFSYPKYGIALQRHDSYVKTKVEKIE